MRSHSTALAVRCVCSPRVAMARRCLPWGLRSSRKMISRCNERREEGDVLGVVEQFDKANTAVQEFC